MSSTVLTANNDYQFPPAPASATLTREVWNATLRDLSVRMRGVEQKGDTLDDLVADLSFTAIQRVDAAISPVITGVQADIAALTAQVAATLEANQHIIEDFQAVTAVNLSDLQSAIADVEARIETILDGGIDASDVVEGTDRVFVTQAQRDAIGLLQAGLAELQDAVNVAMAAQIDAIEETNEDQATRISLLEAADNSEELIALAIAYSGVF